MLDKLEKWKRKFEEHLLLRGFAVRTSQSYVAELGPLFKFLTGQGVTKLSEVNRDCLESYRRHLYYWRFRGKRLAMSSQSNRISAVKAFFAYLTEAQFLLLDPAQSLKIPKKSETLPRELLSEEETEKLLLQPDITTVLGVRDRALLELLYGTGIRNTELRELELNGVDLSRCELFVARGKGNKSRRLPLAEETAAWLESYMLQARPKLAQASSGSIFFLTSTGNGLHRGQLIKIVRSLAQSAGLEKKVTPHVLRHCCATHMLRRGAGVRHLQVLLGHADINATQRYLKVEVGDLRRVVTQYHPREQGLGES